MGNLLDKTGLQYYANKICNADNRTVGSKSLPTVLNEIDTKIDGFKSLFDSEYGTPLDMKLSNNSNIFSVGTGSEADKRSDVENGFTDVELSGNSLVSILSLSYTTSAEISTSYKHIGDFIPNIKPKINQTYTILPLGRSDLTFTFASFYTENGGEYRIDGLRKFGTPFSFILTKETTDIIKFRFYLHGDSVVIPNKTTVKFMIIEGDWTNKPIPDYFEGLKSVGEHTENKISISSQNKNLFNSDEVTFGGYSYGVPCSYGTKVIPNYDNSFTIQTNMNTWNNGIVFCTNVEKNTDYVLRIGSYKNDGIDMEIKIMGVYNSEYPILPNGASLKVYLDRVQTLTLREQRKQLKANSKNYDKLMFYIGGKWNENSVGSKTLSASNIEVMKLNSAIGDYVSPMVDKKEISLSEPLRGLPNGVKDTIEKINGEWKIVRRCGEIIFDGSEDWHIGYGGATGEVNKFEFSIPVSLPPTKTTRILDALSNKFNIELTGAVPNNDWGFRHVVASSGKEMYFLFRIPTSIVALHDLDTWKQWLSQNPVKVIYDLGSPIIEDISPVTLQCWKNGTISIDEVLPIETTHTVALNKSAQIQKNIEELANLRNRVKALEEIYDTTSLQQAHDLELLKSNIELDKLK